MRVKTIEPTPKDSLMGNRYMTDYGCAYEIITEEGERIQIRVVESNTDEIVGTEYAWTKDSIKNDTLVYSPPRNEEAEVHFICTPIEALFISKLLREAGS